MLSTPCSIKFYKIINKIKHENEIGRQRLFNWSRYNGWGSNSYTAISNELWKETQNNKDVLCWENEITFLADSNRQ